MLVPTFFQGDIVCVWYNFAQGEFPEGLVEVCQPIALVEDNPPLYGVSAAGNMTHDIASFPGLHRIQYEICATNI